MQVPSVSGHFLCRLFLCLNFLGVHSFCSRVSLLEFLVFRALLVQVRAVFRLVLCRFILRAIFVCLRSFSAWASLLELLVLRASLVQESTTTQDPQS